MEFVDVKTEQFGQYRLEQLIGKGGMGEVYRAYDTVRGRVVALKRLPAHLASDAEFQARFRKESAVASRLCEPHIIPIHDYGDIDGRLYIDMRLVDGRDLSTVLAEQGPLDPQRAVAVVAQVASALDAAHADGLVHRDVKPSNVLLTGDAGRDFVYLVDFGIARSVGAGTTSMTIVGTLPYIAPERFLGARSDHRVDVYSLACLLFEALTGRPPFRGDDTASMVHAHLNEVPPRPSLERFGVPAALDDVVARGMAKQPEDRYPTARALADAALAAAGRAAIDRTATSVDHGLLRLRSAGFVPPDPAPRPRRRRALMFATAAVIALVVAGTGWAATLLGGDPTADRALWDALKPDGIDLTRCDYVEPGSALSRLSCDTAGPALDMTALFELHPSAGSAQNQLASDAGSVGGPPGTCDTGGRYVGVALGLPVTCGFVTFDGGSYYRIRWAEGAVLGSIVDRNPAVAWQWYRENDPT